MTGQLRVLQHRSALWNVNALRMRCESMWFFYLFFLSRLRYVTKVDLKLLQRPQMRSKSRTAVQTTLFRPWTRMLNRDISFINADERLSSLS